MIANKGIREDVRGSDDDLILRPNTNVGRTGGTALGKLTSSVSKIRHSKLKQRPSVGDSPR